MADSFRALCGELTDKLHQYAETFPEHDVGPLVQRACDLLDSDEPEGEELTDEELLELERVAHDLQWCARGWEPKAMLVGNVRASEIEELCSAFLTRYARPTPHSPADGEVAELVAALKVIDKMQQEWVLRGNDDGTASPSMTMPISLRRFTVIRDALTRAAELLQRFASPACLVINPDKEALAASIAADLAGPGRIELLPDGTQIIEPAEHTLLAPVLQPVPVAERPWEREGWCDGQGRCWALSKIDGVRLSWVLTPNEWVEKFPHICQLLLPFHALPVPTSEGPSDAS